MDATDPYESAALEAVRARLAEAREKKLWGELRLTFRLKGGLLTADLCHGYDCTEKLLAVPAK